VRARHDRPVMPKNTDTVVIQEAVTANGKRIASRRARPGTEPPPRGRDLHKASRRSTRARSSAGGAGADRVARIGEVSVRASSKWRSSPPATSWSRSEKTEGGEVYDSNRYTLWGMLTRLGCE